MYELWKQLRKLKEKILKRTLSENRIQEVNKEINKTWAQFLKRLSTSQNLGKETFLSTKLTSYTYNNMGTKTYLQ